MKTHKNNLFGYSGALVVAVALLCGCSDSFLEQDPLSFYEPATTYTTESGLQSALAMCDLHLKTMIMDGNGNVLPMASNYIMTDIGVHGKTDVGSSFMDDFNNQITPTSGMSTGGDNNAFLRFWEEAYTGIKYANTVLSYLDQVEGLDEDTKNEYMGRALFHRAYKYYNLVLWFGDVPLVTKIITGPKLNYKSCDKEAIFEMLVDDLEQAVEYVPAQSDMTTVGTVNKEACMHLLAKCYLVTGEYAKAEAMCDDLINNYGHALMYDTFGTEVASGNKNTWTITRNVLWDLHRGENVCDEENTEMIMPILNFNSQNFTQYLTMRAMTVHWSNSAIKAPDNVSSPTYNYATTSSSYSDDLDWLRVIGRGIGCFRTTYHYNYRLWYQDGEVDWQDLRHNREVGNWLEMTDLKYNNPSSAYYGQNMQLYATEDYVDSDGNVLVAEGDLLCSDTIRSWCPIPLYLTYVLDQSASENADATQYNGATEGTTCSNGNLYLFRLAETYLIRAEAKFYQGDTSGAADDVNIIRERANAKYMYSTVTIGDIMDERARELYLEEWRHPELVRVSWCLAKSGKADEWGNTYDIDTWDKQDGTDSSGGSYWYKRATIDGMFNQGSINVNSTTLEYIVDKHNMFLPIPNDAIEANTDAPLAQNYGYDGYDSSVFIFDNYEDAIADEDSTTD